MSSMSRREKSVNRTKPRSKRPSTTAPATKRRAAQARAITRVLGPEAWWAISRLAQGMVALAQLADPASDGDADPRTAQAVLDMTCFFANGLGETFDGAMDKAEALARSLQAVRS